MSITIDYMITARCNLKCPFCYGPDPNMAGELSLREKCFLIEQLAKRNVTRIIIAGGEPLVSSDILELAPLIRAHGIALGLQTNGFYLERLRTLIPFLDWLALPIDGVSSDVQSFMRTSSSQLQKTRRAADIFRALAPQNTKLKIGTVLTPRNINELDQIAGEVARIAPNVWKIYQVRPRGAATHKMDQLHLDRIRIEEALLPIRNKFGAAPAVSFVDESVRAYLIVNPDSECLIPLVDKYKSCGHLLDRATMHFREEVWVKFMSQLDTSAQIKNMEKSFPNWDPPA